MPKTILIVEDDELSLRMVTDVLQASGYDVVQSIDGKDTLKLATEQHPDLILMDIRLPEVSGVEHLKALKADEALRDIPVLAVTAFALRGDKEKFLEEGFDAYIPKPVDIPLLLETIAEFLS
jgi:two-component system cell cycle response regulator DivK